STTPNPTSTVGWRRWFSSGCFAAPGGWLGYSTGPATSRSSSVPLVSSISPRRCIVIHSWIEPMGLALVCSTSAVNAAWASTMPRPYSLSCPASPVSSAVARDRKSTRLNSSHVSISYAVFCLKKKIQYIRGDGAQIGGGAVEHVARWVRGETEQYGADRLRDRYGRVTAMRVDADTIGLEYVGS